MQRYEDSGSALLNLGQQQLDAGDFVLPRVKVVQQMAQEVADNKAKAGELYNTLTGENFGKELRFIPITLFKQRIFLVRQDRRERYEAALGAPISEGDGLKCRSFDMQQGVGEPGVACDACPLSKWGPDNTPPMCSETYNVAALTELGDLIILSFLKSSARVGKRMFSMARLSAGAPWTKTYKVTTHQEKNNLGNFFVPDVVVDGQTPNELLSVARSWAGQLGSMVIDVTPEDDEPATAETGDF